MQATMFRTGEVLGNIVKTEITLLGVEDTSYAQYSQAKRVTFRPKRKRSDYQTYFYGAHAYGVIVRGWGVDLTPESMYSDPISTGGVTIREGRRSAYDPGWKLDFDARLAKAVEEGRVEILHDFRSESR